MSKIIKTCFRIELIKPAHLQLIVSLIIPRKGDLNYLLNPMPT